MKDFKLKSRIQMLKESIQIDPRFNINPILQEYLVDDFPVNNFFDYKYSGKKIRLQFTGKDADKAQYHFVGANGESITFDEEMMLKHILNNVLIPEVNPKMKGGEEFGENNTLDKKTLLKPDKHDDKVAKAKFDSENEKDKSKFKATNEKDKKQKFSDLEDKNKPLVKKDISTFKDAQKIDESIETDTIVDDTIVDDTIVDDTIVDDTIVDDTIVDDTIVDDTIDAGNEIIDQTEDTENIENVLNVYTDAIKSITNLTIIEFSDENSEYPHIKFNMTNSDNMFELAYIDGQVQLITISPEDVMILTDPQELLDHLNSLSSEEDENIDMNIESEINTEIQPVANAGVDNVVNESLSTLFEIEDLSKLKKEDLEMFNSLKKDELASLWSGGKIDLSKGFDEIIEGLIDVKGFKEFKDEAGAIVFAMFSGIDERTTNNLSKSLAFNISKSEYEKLNIDDFDDYFNNYEETVSEDPKHTESRSDLKDQFSKASLKKLNSGAELSNLDALAYLELDHDKATKLIEFLNYHKLGVSIKKK